MEPIDIHTHGISGYDTRTTVEEHILKIAEMHGAHGVSEIIPTIYSATIKVMRENMMVVKKAMELQKEGNESNLPPSPEGNKPSRIIGIHLEGPFLNPYKCGSLNAMTLIDPTEGNFNELIDGFEDMIRIITIAPELDGANKLIKKISDMGIIPSMGHSDATYAEAEAGFKSGAKGITHIFNAMREFHHREPGILGFGLMNNDIYIEVIADPYHLDPKTIEMIFRLKNPERIIIISDTVRESKAFAPSPVAVLGWRTEEGVTDKRGRLLGGSMTITESAKRLIEAGYDEEIVTKCITENPGRYLYSSH